MRKRAFLLPAAQIILALLVPISGLAECRAGDPTGRYSGSATSAQAGKLEVSLNLLCTDGQYTGTLDSPVGRYKITGGSFDQGHLQLHLVRAEFQSSPSKLP